MNISRFILLCAAAGTLCAQKIDLRTQTKSNCGGNRLLFTTASTAGGSECDSKLVWNNSTKQFGVGLLSTLNYAFHFEYDMAPTYLALNTGAMFGRKHIADLPSNATTEQVLTVQHDAHYAVGTPWSLAVFLNTKVSNSQGSAGILSRVTKQAESSDISFALHGECFNESSGTCVGANTEVYNTTTTGPAVLYGYVGQVGLTSPGTAHTVNGMRLTLAHPTTNPGYGINIQAVKGTHAYGMRISDEPTDGGFYTGGHYTKALTLHARKTEPNILEFINENPVVAVAPSQIIFARSTNAAHKQAMIESDSMTTSDLGNGYLDVHTNLSGTLTRALRWDNAGNQIMYRGHIRQSTTSLALAGTLDIGQFGMVTITAGTGPITVVTGCDANYPGRELTLYFATTATLTDGGGLTLAGNLSAGAGTTWRGICNGSTWVETSRSIN